MKTIYQAPDEKKALAALDRVTEKWTPKYPNSMKRWKDNWDAISPDFQVFSDCPEGDIYDKCDRIVKFHLSETQPAEKRFSERYCTAESSVPGYFRSYQKMDYNHSQLGAGLWRAEHYV